jgi:hypothetical protein
MHLDLSYTGLDAAVIKRIGAALSKSRGLVALHLNGNPGITKDSIEFLRNRLICKEPVQKIVKINFDDSENKKTLKNMNQN